MLNALPAPVLLDIAIIFTAFAWGLGFYLVDKKVYIFDSLAIGCFVCLCRVQRGRAGLGGGGCSSPIRRPTALVRSAERAENARCLPDYLGDLHSPSPVSQFSDPLRFADSLMETASVRLGKTLRP